ncbi:unnamed protein product [Gongylonema pulchrum]|uniref:NDK domain-containing protein n=1 Tax=Gongylonema pulchrum TaxID=637853 RepID=A0A183E9P9_9BILA|nr:unnamed protein product [Gongylonema pulchrum]
MLLQSSFPGPVRVVFVLKPESVLQRALEVGYRGIAENCKFKSSFPGPVRVVFVLKPESVLQRALEVGYRGIAENCKFKVIQDDI